jgi:hypothetical protein
MHAELDILNDRDKLPPGDWVIRLLLGADGDAQEYDATSPGAATRRTGRLCSPRRSDM